MRAKRAAVMVAIVVCCTGIAVAQTEWDDHPDNPVIGTDDVGAWAPGGAVVSAVVFDGVTFHMWFTGDTETSVAGIGHATSSDGLDWVMDQANPVINMGAEGAWDDEYILGGAVIHDGSTFHMWYTGSRGDGEHVGYATSPDGTVWTKYAGNPVMEHGAPGSWDDWWLGMPSVMPDGDGFKAWYMGSQGSDGVASIGYATSPDGVAWTKRPDPVLEPGTFPGTWEADLFNPAVVFDGSTYHMWYNGDYPNVATKTGYAYSADGIVWTKHRDNPVHEIPNENIVTKSVLRDGTTWRMWYSHFGVDPWRISYATSDCCAGVVALDNWLIIPAAAVASGAQGSFYQTDVDLNNAGGQAVEYQLMWFPRGEVNSEPMTSEMFSLGAGMSVRYANVLTEVFDLEPNSLGAIAVMSTSPDLLAMSRTYNIPNGGVAGTFGQAIPAVPPGDFIRSGERRRILFASEHSDLRTNVGCQNGADMATTVNLELFDADGTSLETARMILFPLSNDQLNRVFEDYMPVNGYVDVWTAMADRSFYCYGSVLDNVTSDPTTILPQ